MRLWKILLALLLALTGSSPSALASIPLAQENLCTGPFRGVVSGSRYYNPTMGRWIGRDHIGERGGINLFAFVKNSSPNACDPHGAATLTDLGAAGGIAGGLAAAGTANYGAIVQEAQVAVEEVELDADMVGALAESDSTAVLNAVTATVNNLKNVTVAIGRLADTAAAQELGIAGRFNVPDSMWNPEVNSQIMQSLINQGQTFYVASPITAGNMWNDMGQMSIFGQELMQLFDAGYTQNGFNMLPP